MATILSKGEHTTLRLVDDLTVTKTATDDGAKKLAKEIEFLELNKSKLHYDFLPDIFSHEIRDNYACYSMPYLSGPLLRDYIYSEASLSLTEQSILRTVTNLNALHRELATADAAEFSREFYIKRLRDRWAKLRFGPNGSQNEKAVFSVEDISSSDVSTTFTKIAKGTVLLIDGKEIDFSLETLVDSLTSLDEVFSVPQTSMRLIHGDPHAGNILLHDDNAIFLDPNGFMDGGDIAYDFGKLLVSFDWHDLSMMDMLEPAKIGIDPKSLSIVDNKVYKDLRVQKRHAVLRKRIIQLLAENVSVLYGNDPLLLKRAELLLYIHQFSFAPTLIKEKPRTALHVLLNAISDYTALVENQVSCFS